MLNSVVLMGRLTANPELRQTPSGVSVASFTLAVNRTFNRDQTDFINIVAWRQQADFVSKYFAKGQLMALEGSIQVRNYEDKNGNKRQAVEVVANQIHFAESKNSSPKPSNNFPIPSEMDEPVRGSNISIGNMDDYEELDMDDGDLPF